MSTNDDSASRQGRRADQGERRGPGMRAADERWEQSSPRDRAAADRYAEPQGREAAPSRSSYSNYSRPAYPAPEPAPAPQPQGFFPEPAPRGEPPRFSTPAGPSFAPTPSYEPDHMGFHDGGRDDLFAREPSPAGYETNPYSAQTANYHADLYEQNRGAQPPAPRREEPQFAPPPPPAPSLDDYERNFTARVAQETQASRFYLTEDEPQKPRQPQQERSFTPPNPTPPQYAQNFYPAEEKFAEEDWHEEHPIPGEEQGGHLEPHGNELDEDFFADEDDLEHEQVQQPKRGKTKLIAAALVAAIAMGGSGAYFYKASKGGSEASSTPILRASSSPVKEAPGDPGGAKFPKGEKTIYDRLTPDGQQMRVASMAPAAQPAPPPASSGNSLEERIDEALRKAQRSGDAPQFGIAPPPPASAPASRGSDQPTMVRSESYRPDGTRVDSPRPSAPVADMNSSPAVQPFGAVQAPSTPAPATPAFRTAPVASTPAPQPAPAQRNAQPAMRTASLTPVEAAPPASTGGFWVSLSDKYKSVLGEVQVISKVADLGAKGVTYRAVAGPLGTKQEAAELCQKIKGVGGDKACFVTN
jgi:hypothetical protein